MPAQIATHLNRLFERWAGQQPERMTPLPPSGSPRQYYRLAAPHATAIGAFNPDQKENAAFVYFSKHFRAKGLRVPQIYAEDLDRQVYLLEDLGDATLFACVTQARSAGTFPDAVLPLYRQVIEQLPRFQIEAGRDLDYQVCYLRAAFDQQSMLWDLNYFKYYFLKLAQIPFDEQGLEEDFQRFSAYLLQTDRDFFLYRDFQSRNIMLHRDAPYFIDYQGGRRGALPYDLASLLFDAKADLPPAIRDTLLAEYLDAVNRYIAVETQDFRRYFYGYALIRIMQAMGAYGFRGFYEGKAHFLQSIPYALDNLAWLLEHASLPIRLPVLQTVWERLAVSEKLRALGKSAGRLQVQVNSFSYKRGLPPDPSGHGGGYVFDCRALPNPGRYPEYQHLTGKDAAVIEFLEPRPEVQAFLRNICALVDQSVENYLQRNFTHLTINFGCTGGQHRSVYCAEQLAAHLQAAYDVDVRLQHLEQDTR